MNFKLLNTVTGWVVFAIAVMVYALTAEPTGSLWDCGEFISAAHKLEVVHPPGAPLFLMLGRLFEVFMSIFLDMGNPENIAYSINLLSGVCTAFSVLFIFWTTTIFAKLSLKGMDGEPKETGEVVAILGSGVVAGLAATFATSIWFSAVEGEVYAMSLFFTGLVVWAAARWYVSTSATADRWLVFIAYTVGLSIGVHLLSLLVIPFVAMLYYYKKRAPQDKPVLQVKRDAEGNEYSEEVMVSKLPFLGSMISFVIGFVILAVVQYFIIPKIPQIAAAVDYTFVNSFGMGLGSGVLFTIVLLVVGIAAGFFVAYKKQNYFLQLGMSMFAMILIGFSTYGMIVIRAHANPPINMNDPSDPYSLLSYLNREQYGDRPLLYGPHFMAQRKGYDKKGDVYRPVKDAKTGKYKYEVVDEKIEVEYNSKDYMLFPRLGHMDRGGQYRAWLGMKGNSKPTMGDNFGFFFRYQIGWMYMRYFMWNFVGRQNAQQGFYASDTKRGNWISGIGFIDELRVHPQSGMPDTMANDKGRNTYYFLPLIFGLTGMFFHFSKRSREALAVLALFFMTGLAIILFLNQPPQEPRERDYAFAASILTFCIWIGMAVPAFFDWLKGKMGSVPAGSLSSIVCISAPLIMGIQNWDDHSRAGHTGARDYAVNFLESCAPNAIVFTYGDNDTYPLWYAQEVEGIRTDVRVINFSLLAVDWYINQLRRKINESPAVKMTISEDAYRGKRRNYIPVIGDTERSLMDIVKHISEPHAIPQQPDIASYANAERFFIPIDSAAVRRNNVVPADTPDSLIVKKMQMTFDGKQFLMKDEIALIDIIATNAQNGWERPIYFAVTNRPEKIMGFRDYLQLEGMALRIVPIKTPSKAEFGAMGMGRVATDLMFDNMMNKFRWGNFDKEELFVDESYMPSVHSLQYGFVRLMGEHMQRHEIAKFLQQPDEMAKQKEKVFALADKMLKSFPDFNFPLAENRICLQVFDYMYRIGGEDNIKEYVLQMATGLAQRQAFLESLSHPKDLQSFGQDIEETAAMINGLLQVIERGTNAETKNSVKGLLGQYAQQTTIPKN